MPSTPMYVPVEIQMAQQLLSTHYSYSETSLSHCETKRVAGCCIDTITGQQLCMHASNAWHKLLCVSYVHQFAVQYVIQLTSPTY